MQKETKRGRERAELVQMFFDEATKLKRMFHPMGLTGTYSSISLGEKEDATLEELRRSRKSEDTFTAMVEFAFDWFSYSVIYSELDYAVTEIYIFKKPSFEWAYSPVIAWITGERDVYRRLPKGYIVTAQTMELELFQAAERAAIAIQKLGKMGPQAVMDQLLQAQREQEEFDAYLSRNTAKKLRYAWAIRQFDSGRYREFVKCMEPFEKRLPTPVADQFYYAKQALESTGEWPPSPRAQREQKWATHRAKLFLFGMLGGAALFFAIGFFVWIVLFHSVLFGYEAPLSLGDFVESLSIAWLMLGGIAGGTVGYLLLHRLCMTEEERAVKWPSFGGKKPPPLAVIAVFCVLWAALCVMVIIFKTMDYARLL